MNSAWEEVTCSTLNVGDIVRVKHDAYSSAAGKMHNGRLVKVVKVKDGDVHVTSIDLKLPYISNCRHAPYRLEKKVRDAE